MQQFWLFFSNNPYFTRRRFEILEGGDKSGGDGDFEPLIERLLQKDIKVYLVSSVFNTKNGLSISGSRFAKKLKGLIERFPNKVIYLEINDWKLLIEKNK